MISAVSDAYFARLPPPVQRSVFEAKMLDQEKVATMLVFNAEFSPAIIAAS